MANYIILNGKNSNTITGLLIQNLPPISKPLQRTLIEEIDGRDGDIVTKLGYGAYDKEITIGLYGSYNVDDVISYFDSEGVVTFSNEPDKYYNYQIIDQIDFERLIRFKTATVRMHVQPFKYLLNEPEIEVDARSVTGEGQNIELKYTIENGSLSITPKGNTEQDSYTGKNLLNNVATTQTLNGITFTKREDGSMLVNGTSTNLVTLNLIGDNIFTLSAGQYKISGCPSGGSDSSYRLDINNGAVPQQREYGNGSTFTITEALIVNNVRIRIPSGVTVNNLIFKPMIRLASITDDTYEPYVGGIPSPNPDYPQPVKVVTGNNTIKVEGKNLCNNNYLNLALNYLNNEIISDANSRTMYAKVPKNTDITISKTNVTNRLRVGLLNKIPEAQDTFYLAYRNDDSSTLTTTINTGNYEYVAVQYTNQSQNTNLMIEQGSTASDYEEYQSQTYSLNLGSIELCKIGTYQDYIYKENNKWYKHSEIGKYVYNNDLNSNGIDNDKVNFVTPVLNIEENLLSLSNIAICNMLKSQQVNETGLSGTTSQKRIRVNTKGYGTTYDEVKTIFANNNLTIYYGLETPTNTEITDTDLINQLESINSASAYKEVTNISSTCASGNSLMYMSAVSVGMPNTTIKNNGNIFAKPILTIYGSGEISVYLDTIQVLQIDLGDYGSITIDVSQLEAYNESTGDLMNRNVIGDYSNLKVNCGDNDLTFSGNVMGFTMTKYNRWL